MQTQIPILVLAHETDYGGVVSNVRYLEYIERARYALLHVAGLPVEKTWREVGVQMVVRHVEIEYLGFARHEDELEIVAKTGEFSGARAVLEYELKRPSDGATIMKARQTVAFLNTNWKPVRIPPIFREKLK